MRLSIFRALLGDLALPGTLPTASKAGLGIPASVDRSPIGENSPIPQTRRPFISISYDGATIAWNPRSVHDEERNAPHHEEG
jgi:hypothetical protein